ncbi:MAG: hypothetical protein U0168_21235 [Nannocystaceae bacterium]
MSVPKACTSVCPADLVPADPFIAFSPGGDNVPDVAAVDIDGDGVGDSAVAQTLACIGPQGIDGCGYEAPLESMMQALDPGASWNDGARPFLRPGALLAIAIVTDEVECSVRDYEIMTDPSLMELDPDDGTPAATSALCWHAGVTCNGPDADGVYSDCRARDDELRPDHQRYVDYLVGTPARAAAQGDRHARHPRRARGDRARSLAAVRPDRRRRGGAAVPTVARRSLRRRR